MRAQTLHTIGILGLGRFGAFAASHFAKNPAFNIIGHDVRTGVEVPGLKAVDFAQVVAADVLILAFPLKAYPQLLPRIAGAVRPETLIVDVCSIKLRPTQYFKEYLAAHSNILLTHPLFGPQSAAHSTKGHTLIVTKARGDRAERALAYCSRILGLDVQTMTPEAHDQLMARIHVLTFFVARGLGNMQLKKVPFMTPSYKMITDLVDFNSLHSDELFKTIQEGNPYSKEVRAEFIRSLEAIQKELQ